MAIIPPQKIEICNFKPGDIIGGTWSVDSFLGEGTFGQVYRVRGEDNQLYALKLLKLWIIPESERRAILNRFDREYETGLTRSRYLVHSICKGETGGNPYIVMDYCPGGDLKKAFRTQELDLPVLAKHVLLGLRDLHTAGRVHRDLKPENVLLMDPNHAVLTDFGIAGDQNNRLTRRGVSGVPLQRFGTMAYMPPEQANPRGANATVLPTTDLFSFGVMIFQLLTGELPFGTLSSPADVVPYTRRAAAGDWNRTLVCSRSPIGERWLPLLEATLEPEFSKRIQTAQNVIELLPLDHEDISYSEPTLPETFPTDLSVGVILRITLGDGQGTVYDLNNLKGKGNIITIGRHSPDIANTISLRGESASFISRQHCSLEHNPDTGRWLIRDGQFRIQCPRALILPKIFPCRECSESGGCNPQRQRLHRSRSLNGTYLNSTELDSRPLELNAGDIISLGDIKMRVEGIPQ
ncbi:MAG: FHA domain-containing serine/threonine-protein kinase [Clostridium sp.]|nr:FHA domain-containing serine/threonine-protein kinase [Prevotella sp.]MCM1428480.1 FHA domain-containing serine/threonine-protein kinase [Clostridium sp.]MCM1475890.1 FHA domain-containing serine/threonine-protein kinase [Muribaculaceae bacterium]